MTKKDMDQTLTDLNGDVLKDGEGKDIALKGIIVSALLATFPDEQNLSGDDKFIRFMLAMKLNKGGEQDLSPEEIVLIKKLVAKGWGALIVGKTYEIMNA